MSCPICSHRERKVIDAWLRGGYRPRAIAQRVANVTRPQVQRHRDKCLAPTEEHEGGDVA
jgi:hypothetical protein